MNLSHFTFSSQPHFCARSVGSVQLNETKAHVFRLEDPEDIVFLDKALKHIESLPYGKSFIPKHPHIKRDNHIGLAHEAIEMAKKALVALERHSLNQPPLILVMVDQSNRLLGLCVGHMERTLSNDDKVYTPLRRDLEYDRTRDSEANHSSVNWIVSLSSVKGVGKSLLALYELILPPSVQRVDLCSETEEYTASAKLLYEKLGFRVQTDLLKSKPITIKHTPDRKLLPFSDPHVHKIPMSVSRATYESLATKIREYSGFEETLTDQRVDLSVNPKFFVYD